MNKQAKNRGFTLVELLLSVGIASIMMVGISAFFSSTFRNMFTAREKVSNTQSQFVVSTILGGKFANAIAQDTNNSCGNECAVLYNDMNSGDLPFTYIGKETVDGDDYVVFKDMFVFNGQEGNVSSIASTVIENPGGLTELNGEYYVTSPLENKIYSCNSNLTSCNDLGIVGLDIPIDIADNDGAPPNDILYVSSAGDNRIVLIQDPTNTKVVTEIEAGLNFPTGLEYYAPADEFLFVSDTNNHQVKRVNLATEEHEIVVGAGDDELCDNSDGRDHSAASCKLSFPTGLVIGDAGNGSELYISDTGNGRLLKVTDPNPDLTDFELQVDLGMGATQVKRIDFELPKGSVINSVSQGVSPNTLHKTRYEVVDETVTAWLSAEQTSNVISESCFGDPEVCNYYFRAFYVDETNDIYEALETIDIESIAYTVDFVTDEVDGFGGTRKVVMQQPLNEQIDPAPGTEIPVIDSFSGQQSFYLDLSDIIFPDAFNSISVQAFNEADLTINDPAEVVSVRIGDGTLGTAEDTISLVANYPYPTDVSWYSGAPRFSGPPQIDAEYDTDYSDSGWDYTSEFEVTNFAFSTKNGGAILELTFDAKLAEDPEGNEQWETYTLNADVAP